MAKPKRSKITWTDYSGGCANFIIGCTPASTGCANCYGKEWARKKKWNDGDFSKVTLYPDKLRELARVKFNENVTHYRRGLGARPTVFVVDLGDLFHDIVPNSFILEALAIMTQRIDVDWQLLTKRPQRALEVIRDPLPRNVWMGVTCENQKRATERLPILARIPAALRWVSIEPMLAPMDLGPHLAMLDWVVVGAESGNNRRYFSDRWAWDVLEQCAAAGVPFFFKQSSGRYPGTDPYLHGRLYQEIPGTPELQPTLF